MCTCVYLPHWRDSVFYVARRTFPKNRIDFVCVFVCFQQIESIFAHFDMHRHLESSSEFTLLPHVNHSPSVTFISVSHVLSPFSLSLPLVNKAVVIRFVSSVRVYVSVSIYTSLLTQNSVETKQKSKQTREAQRQYRTYSQQSNIISQPAKSRNFTHI